MNNRTRNLVRILAAALVKDLSISTGMFLTNCVAAKGQPPITYSNQYLLNAAAAR